MSPSRLIHRRLVLLAAGALALGHVHAQQDLLTNQQTSPGPLVTWLDGDCLLGDCGGLRAILNDRGVEFFGGYSAEVWGNTSGGLKRGTVYTGLLDFGLNVDLEKLVGWKGASFGTTWVWLSGRDASEDLVGNFLTISNIAGFNTLRNYELWFQQDFWQREGTDAGPGLSIRVGQLNADGEFIISDYGANFLNGSFGWPAFAYTNIPNDGPGYPSGAPGIRIAATPAPWFTFQAVAYQGDVFPQQVNTVGFDWRLQRDLGYTLLGEAQFRWNHADTESGLPGRLKLGAWFDTADYPAANGDAVYWGNSGYYLVLDQQLTREPSPEPTRLTGKDAKTVTPPDGKSGKKSFEQPVPLEKSSQGLGAFTRLAFGLPDRSFVGFYFETGLAYTGLIPGRDGDTVGIALAYAGLTPGAAQTLFDDGSRQAGYEAVIEAIYDAQITKWLHVKPDLQYVIRPDGSGGLGNALVLGARVSVTF